MREAREEKREKRENQEKIIIIIRRMEVTTCLLDLEEGIVRSRGDLFHEVDDFRVGDGEVVVDSFEEISFDCIY
jgi:hypothetical protein